MLLIVCVAAITLSLFIAVPKMLNATIHLFPSIGTTGTIGATSTNGTTGPKGIIGTQGTVSTVGIKLYSDAYLKSQTTQIQWGKTHPGSLTNVTLYAESISNVQTKLSLQTANWTFFNSANEVVSGPNETTPYLNLTWNYNNASISPGQVIPVTLTLSVTDSPTFINFLADNKVTGFSFDVTISATEQAE